MISKKEVKQAMKGMTGFRKELEKEKKRLQGNMKAMKKYAASGKAPGWADEVSELYSQKDYSYWKLLKTLRKHKVL